MPQREAVCLATSIAARPATTAKPGSTSVSSGQTAKNVSGAISRCSGWSARRISRSWAARHGATNVATNRFTIRPCELKDANAFVARLHRHHKPVVGHRFSIGCWLQDASLVGVAIIGRPVARMTNQRQTVEVTRLCTDGTEHACSALYAAAARIAKEIGYAKIQTFILVSEPGTSLKAAGWLMEMESAGGDWNRASHRSPRRVDQPMCPKQRWGKVLHPESAFL